ncbi:hypothetical protein R3W88_011029 [Solanum pinnatisectum]|uniref:Uncharacterized protein n=1 Tax=Solanum pinnatisectum TaxID=50273 RepID=A0AAV9L5E1_9SOLN|nr:hypothetical protein R3W88_011029 [Solanum pinnatisectum]
MKMIITCIFALLVIQEMAIFQNCYLEIWPLLAVYAEMLRPSPPPPPPPLAAPTIRPRLLIVPPTPPSP